ncbi:MAG: hypothetical protein LC808_04555 [Actinobacteria bacterium]|nr:hypothetical protein [Actinomycetota bacterium]
MQTPTWVLIVALVAGPAVTATIVNHLLGRRLTDYKASVDAAMSKGVEDHKASLDRQLEEHKRRLDMEASRKLEYDHYLRDQQEALRTAFVNIFEKGPTLKPSELREVLVGSDNEIMGPFRRHQYELPTELQHKILDMHNRVAQAISPDGKPPSAETIARLWAIRDAFYAGVKDTGAALEQERMAAW